MNDFIALNDEQKSEVKVIYRMYKRGKWYQSDTPMYGYEKYYYATKVRIRLYYKDKESAEKEAEKYNKRRSAYEKGKFPKIVTWSMFAGTELHNNYLWWHDSGSWLYAHGYDDWEVEELMTDDMNFQYDDYNHTTADFFRVMFTIPRFSDYELTKDAYGNYKIRKRI